MTTPRPRIRRLRLPALMATLLVLIVTSLPGAAPASAGGSTPNVVQVELGDSFACARKSDLSVWCWGRNHLRQLNDGTTTQRRRPVRSQVTQAVDIAVGTNHACALRTDGRIWCWGPNASGELGDGTTLPRTGMRRVALPIAAWVDISAGGGTTCARLDTGQDYCWGLDTFGQVGNGPNPGAPPPTHVATPAVITIADQVAPGLVHTCAVDVGGPTWCWGRNFNYQLGDGTNSNRSAPERVDHGGVFEDARSVDTGDGFTCARKVDYTVWCWGSNSHGKLGRGSYGDLGIGIGQVVGLDDARQLSLHGQHACATDADRRVWCWGNNNTKQLGVVNYSGTPESRNRPVRVPNIADVAEIDVGISASLSPPSPGGFTCARKSDGTVWCWGRNDRGQLGDGTTTDRRRPEPVLFP